MNRIEFNRAEFNWGEEFYDIIMKKLDLPKWFGKNLDALWDMLTGYIGLPCEFVFVGFDKEENEYNAFKISGILQCFKDAQEHYPNQIKVSIL